MNKIDENRLKMAEVQDFLDNQQFANINDVNLFS